MLTRINPLREKGLLRSHQQVKDETNERFADYLRQRRKVVRASQQDLSIDLRRGLKYIWRIENGYHKVDLYEFIEIVQALGDDPLNVLKEMML